MFGNAPKALWSRWVEVDESNRIPLSCRALLVVEPDGRRILFEAGIGTFFEPKLKERFGVVEEEHMLLTSLGKIGLTHRDIDVVVLSHLHFDHAGGLLSAYSPEHAPELLFPKAEFVVSEAAWERALAPHARDRASFIPILHDLLKGSGRLTQVKPGDTASQIIGPGYRFHYSHGHTPGLLLTEIAMQGGPVVFGGDLIPGVPWVHLPITMGYDRYPEMLIEEKQTLLEYLVGESGRLFFTHDSDVSLAGVTKNERGRYSVTNPQEFLTAFEK